MTIQDIMLEQQLDTIRQLDHAWARFQAEAHELDRAARRAAHRGPLPAARAWVAAALVRLGVWLDRAAGERVITPSA